MGWRDIDKRNIGAQAIHDQAFGIDWRWDNSGAGRGKDRAGRWIAWILHRGHRFSLVTNARARRSNACWAPRVITMS